jgi:predicted dinucleotide-binding enzyme
MRIAVIGRGRVGGGLADRWEQAGHDVTRIGRDGGDVSEAEVVLLAAPGSAVEAALDGVQGIEGKVVVDATNLVNVQPPGGFASNAEYVRSRTGGPTAKAFNINFANLYDRLDEARAKPGNLWCGDEDARTAVEELSRDAGYEPICAGGLDQAAAQEAFLGLVFSISQSGLGPFVYRMAPPEEL